MSGIIFEKDGTAQGVAKQRLIETIANPDERIINDPYADRFVLGASLIKFLGHKLNVWLAQKLAPGFHEHVISRTRFIDDLIEKNAASEVEQYVILGAGYDCRAHRLELPSSLRILKWINLKFRLESGLNSPKSYLTQKMLLMWLLISLTSR